MDIVIFGQPKSGTTFLFYLLKQALPDDTQTVFERADNSIRDNQPILAKVLLEKHISTSFPEYENFTTYDKTLFLVRDPRDWIISAVLFLTQTYPTIYSKPAIIEDILLWLKLKQDSPQSYPFNQLIRKIVEYTSFKEINNLLSSLEKHHKWLFNFESQLKNPCRIHYEALLQQQLEPISKYLGISIPYTSVEIPDYHNHVIRSCASGNWKHWFTPEDEVFFKPLFADYLDRYYPDHDWELAETPRIDPEHGTMYVDRVVNKRRAQNQLPIIHFLKQLKEPLKSSPIAQPKTILASVDKTSSRTTTGSSSHPSSQFSYENFRLDQGDDPDTLLPLFSQAFHQMRTGDEWAWSYQHSPGGSRIILAKNKDKKIAFHYGGIYYKAICRSKPVTIAAAVDAFAIYKYRACREAGQLVIVKTAKLFFQQCQEQDGIQFFFGFPNQKHSKLGRIKIGYHALDNWATYHYALNRNQFRTIAQTGRIRQVKQFGPEFDVLWEKNQHRYQLAICRNAEFLNWRFIAHPSREYLIWSYSSFLNSGVDGYLVFKQQANKALLLDICLPSHQNEIEWFWNEVCQRLQWEEITIIETWFASCSPYKTQLIQLGFIEVCQGETGDENQVAPNYLCYEDSDWYRKNYYFSMADSDLY